MEEWLEVDTEEVRTVETMGEVLMVVATGRDSNNVA